jgi:ribosomal-protein-alanine N-acetyltransferase
MLDEGAKLSLAADARGRSETQILTATWRDLRPIVALERICFGADSWPWIEVLAALTFPRTCRLKALSGGQVVGFVIGDRKPSLGWIASIGVHPDHRRRGVGRQLMEACELALGTERVRLSLRTSNTTALSLYQQMGYVQVDVWPGYYRDGEDGLVMERTVE